VGQFIGSHSTRRRLWKRLTVKEAKDKFKEVLKKYNGKVVFGIAGEHADW